MERTHIEGDARFSVQPTKKEMKAASDAFKKVLKKFNGDHNKAVDYYNKQNEITAADIRMVCRDTFAEGKGFGPDMI